MYTIKQAAARTGISVPVLRAWERRYGVVEPGRTPSGYRIYDEAAIARLRAMRHLVDQGWSRGAAAAELAALSDEAVRTLADAAPPAASTVAASTGPDLIAAFVHAAAKLDTARLDSVLDEIFAQGSFEYVADRYLLPALVELGAAWQAGRVDVAAEHAASHAVLRRLGAAFEAAGHRRGRGATVIVGLPPGSHHELGALAFSIAARRAGLSVVYEGADLPAEEWLEAAASTHARAAVIGVVTPSDRGPAEEVARLLRNERPDLLVAFGGRAAPEDPAGPWTISLPNSLVAAVDGLRSALR